MIRIMRIARCAVGTGVHTTREGKVVHIQDSGYFTTRIKLDARALAKLDGVKLQPGMPAEVMIVTGERRAIDYFIAPLTERMRRAFREQ